MAPIPDAARKTHFDPFVATRLENVEPCLLIASWQLRPLPSDLLALQYIFYDDYWHWPPFLLIFGLNI